MEKISILHTNDIHSHLDKWPRIRRYLTNVKEKLYQNNHYDEVLTFDIGDAIDREHPLSEATDGKYNIKLLNEINYDGVTIGNNEGITNSHEQLNDLYNDANFDIILANLMDGKNTIPSWAKPYKIIETKQHTRILVTGLTSPYVDTYKYLGWNVTDPINSLEKLLKSQNGNFDMVILLSHLGITTDRKLAKRFSDLDIIIGAHTHHLLVNGEMVNNSLLAAAGKWGEYIGQIDLELEHHRIIKKTAKVVETTTLETNSEDLSEIKKYVDTGEKLLQQHRLGLLTSPMETNLIGPSRIVNESLHALEESTGTEASIINSGLFLDGLPIGITDENQIHKILPHAMHPMIVELDGYNLWRMVKEMLKNKNFLVKYQQQGMGFRGKYFGELNFLGIDYDTKKQQLFWHGELVLPTNRYKISMPDHYLYIPFFPTIEIMGKNEILYDQTLRSMFGRYISNHYPIEKGE